MNRFHRSRFRLGLAVAFVLGASVVGAEPPLKVGTLAPDSSIWAKTLREMGDGWARRTGGRITLRLLAGAAGSEEQMLRNLRVAKTLQAAQISAITLGNHDDGFKVFELPMFFASYEEVDAVMKALGPLLEKRLEQQNLKLLHWGYAGWVHVFSRTPVRSVDDLKKVRLFTSTGDDRLPKWYRENGFRPVPVDSSEILQALMTKMIDAVPVTPLTALLFRWSDHVPFMLDVGIAPLMGATVMSMDAWGRLGTADQLIVLEEGAKAASRLRAEVPRLDAEAVASMKARKLTVSQGDVAEWRNASERFGSTMRDRLVPADVFDLALRERDLVRARRAAAK